MYVIAALTNFVSSYFDSNIIISADFFPQLNQLVVVVEAYFYESNYDSPAYFQKKTDIHQVTLLKNLTIIFCAINAF